MNSRDILIRIIQFLSIFGIILIFSISGYMIIEGWGLFDSLYMTVITIATIGFQEVHPLSYEGRVHTLLVVFTGVGFFSSMIVYFSSLIIEGKLRGVLRSQTMEVKIKNLKHHYIICGYGRIGREVCETLKAKKNIDFIIIEKDSDKAFDAEEDGYLVYKGNATDDESLINVRIDKANGIICALTDDALNVFITLSARVLNPNINIIARADKVESVDKLKRAGADTVVAPYVIGGRRMASAVTQPFVLDFLDTVLHDENFDLQLEQVFISHTSKLVNTSIQSANIRGMTGVIVVAIKKAIGELLTNPKPDDLIESGDVLIVLGTTKQIELLNQMAKV